ncbi:hypothetical protein ABFS83_09G093300 [Erythranthe nasuta]
MGSEIIKLPVVDFSNLKQETETWEFVKVKVREALEEYGCFEAILPDRKIPLNLRKSIFDGLSQLFDLPLETKQRNMSDKHTDGYRGQYKNYPLFESLGIHHPLILGNLESFANLMWAQGNPTFSKSVESICEELFELDKNVRRMVLESVGLDKYMDEHMDSTYYLVRCQKYDAPQTNETEVALPPHTDKNIITILYENGVNGLEVMTENGKWIAFKPSTPNSCIVMAGEAFHAWTNGRLRSAGHKVVMAGEKARYSVGLFSVPKSDYLIKAPEEAVDEEHPLLYKPFLLPRFLEFSYAQDRFASQNSLKAYCGI